LPRTPIKKARLLAEAGHNGHLPCYRGFVSLAAFRAFGLHLGFGPGIDLPAAFRTDTSLALCSRPRRQKFISTFRTSQFWHRIHLPDSLWADTSCFQGVTRSRVVFFLGQRAIKGHLFLQPGIHIAFPYTKKLRMLESSVNEGEQMVWQGQEGLASLPDGEKSVLPLMQ